MDLDTHKEKLEALLQKYEVKPLMFPTLAEGVGFLAGQRIYYRIFEDSTGVHAQVFSVHLASPDFCSVERHKGHDCLDQALMEASHKLVGGPVEDIGKHLRVQIEDPDESAGDTIRRWLQRHPKETFRIALSAVAGLYLDENYVHILPEPESNPRGSGSDYVDEVGESIEETGLREVIEKLQGKLAGEKDETPDPGLAIETMERIAQDTKKEFVYMKHIGKWCWGDRDCDHPHGPFDTRLEALRDAVGPYMEGGEGE